jgi:hypothetical protein
VRNKNAAWRRGFPEVRRRGAGGIEKRPRAKANTGELRHIAFLGSGRNIFPGSHVSDLSQKGFTVTDSRGFAPHSMFRTKAESWFFYLIFNKYIIRAFSCKAIYCDEPAAVELENTGAAGMRWITVSPRPPP